MNISTAGLITANAGISTTTLTTSDKITTALGKPIIIGISTKGVGATGGLELHGTEGNANGPHIQAFVHTSVYPTFQLLNYSQDNIALSFDSYWEGGGWKSSDPGSNFQKYKMSDKLAFNYKLGVSLGGAIAFSEAMNISNAGDVIIPTASSGSLTLRKRSSPYSYDPQIFFKSRGYTNYGIIVSATGVLHAWTTSNSTGEPSGAYNYVPLNGAWTYSLDRRLKSDIKALDCGDCCEKLMKINCCSYYLKSDEKKEQKNHGFIADEVKKIFPEFVSESGMKADDGNGNLESITYTSFIPILVSAFQHLKEKVITSIDAINNLEKENKTLINILQDQANQLAEIRAVVFPNML